MNDVPSHTWLNEIQEHFPVIAGVTATAIGALKLWHSRRKAVKEDRDAVRTLARNAVTPEQLLACKVSVDNDRKELIDKLDNLVSANSTEHQDILKHIGAMHGND